MNIQPSRRRFLVSCGTLIGTNVFGTPSRRKRVAILATEVTVRSHPQHFIDRFLVGYNWAGAWHSPEPALAAIYVDQFPEGELSRDTAQRHGVPIFSSIAEALTLGTSKLAVDAVLIIGEHGKYPRNEKGQTRYPRYQFFKEIIRVFESSGRSVPVFNDKHLSTEWHECVEMVADSRRLGFPFQAGSSLPVTRRIPNLEIPLGTPLSESVCVGYGGMDSYDFHGLETAQCMSERRRGGEVGIRLVESLRGTKMWERVGELETTRRLLVAALSRSYTLPIKNGYVSDPVSFEWAKTVFPEGWAYFIEHRDGFRTTLFMLGVQDFNYAGMNARTGQIYSCQMYLPMPTRGSTTADFFNPQIHYIEQMISRGRAPYPVERTLLTSGMTLAGVESFFRNRPIETPEMTVRYSAPKNSLYWRE